MPNIDSEPLLTIKEVAEKFNLKESRIRWEIYHRRIPIYKIGSSIRLRASEIESWIMSKRKGA
jgi:excisionase family DNA binding protein